MSKFTVGDFAVVAAPGVGHFKPGQVVRVIPAEGYGLEEDDVMVAPVPGPGIGGSALMKEGMLQKVER